MQCARNEKTQDATLTFINVDGNCHFLHFALADNNPRQRRRRPNASNRARAKRKVLSPQAVTLASNIIPRRRERNPVHDITLPWKEPKDDEETKLETTAKRKINFEKFSCEVRTCFAFLLFQRMLHVNHFHSVRLRDAKKQHIYTNILH